MRPTGSGPLGALLMLAPLIAVPILAVVGIPQFAPGNLIDPHSSNSHNRARDQRANEETGFGDDRRAEIDDLFESPERSKRELNDFSDPLPSGHRNSRDSENDNQGRDRFDQDLNEREEQPINDDERDESFGASLEENLFEEPDLKAGRRRRPNSSPEADSLDDDRVDSGFDQSAKRNDSRRRPPKSSPPRDSRDAPYFAPPGSKSASTENDPGFADVAPPSRMPGRNSQKEISSADAFGDTSLESTEFETSPTEPGTSDVREQAPQIDELTWQIATRRLKKLGANQHHFTYLIEHDRFLFTCEATNPDQSGSKKRFQSEADEPLLAVRQVLEKLETWQTASTQPRTRTRTRRDDGQ